MLLTRYETLIKAIRVNTLSKLTFDDAVRFLALLGDVFPGVRSEGVPTSQHSLANSVTTTPLPLHIHSLPRARMGLVHGCRGNYTPTTRTHAAGTHQH